MFVCAHADQKLQLVAVFLERNAKKWEKIEKGCKLDELA